jgi:type VI protein secretion system component VasA
MENKEAQKGRNTLQEYFAVNEMFAYFVRVFKKDPNRKANFNLRVMHGINRISILMFLFALIVWLIKRMM